MSYISLYRKYRPNTFQEVVGQEGAVIPLQNSIKKNLLSHAYIFYGPRGTGKTTLARIFAKAINCLNPINGEACNTCEVCETFKKHSIIDVIEIDAASNNGVDEIRDLREKALLMPAKCNYKVYIIDEVHMLSNSAFNALLKILEEPPIHVIFILATTEFYKIPATIVSRCQQYNFHKLTIKNLEDNLIKILKQEQIPYENSAINQIALLANGACRDSITILEQVILFSEGKVTLEKVNKLFSIVSKAKKMQLFDAILASKAEIAIKLIKEIINSGSDCELLLINFLSLVKEILEFQTTKNVIFLNFLSETESKFYSEIISEQELINILNILTEMYLNIRFNKTPEIYLELVILKMLELFKENPKDISLFSSLKINNLSTKTESNNNIFNNQVNKIDTEILESEKNDFVNVSRETTSKSPQDERKDIKDQEENDVKLHAEQNNVEEFFETKPVTIADYYNIAKEKYNIYEIKDINYSTFEIINVLINAARKDREDYETKFKELIINNYETNSPFKDQMIAFNNVKYAAGSNKALIVITNSKTEANWISYLLVNNEFRSFLYQQLGKEFIIIPLSEVEFITIRNDYLQMRQVNKLPTKKVIDIELFYKNLLEKQFNNFEEHRNLIEKGKNIFNNIKIVD